MSKKDTRTIWQQELDECRDRAAERDAHRNETLTRGEVLDAIETVASEYGGAGTPPSNLIADAFRKLAKALS